MDSRVLARSRIGLGFWYFVVRKGQGLASSRPVGELHDKMQPPPNEPLDRTSRMAPPKHRTRTRSLLDATACPTATAFE